MSRACLLARSLPAFVLGIFLLQGQGSRAQDAVEVQVDVQGTPLRWYITNFSTFSSEAVNGNMKVPLLPGTYSFRIYPFNNTAQDLFSFEVGGDGTVLPASSEQALGAMKSLTLKTHPVQVDVGGYENWWHIADFMPMFIGNIEEGSPDQPPVLLPAATYSFGLWGRNLSLFHFDVLSDGSLQVPDQDPDRQYGKVVNGRLLLITQAITVDAGGYTGRWLIGQPVQTAHRGDSTVHLPAGDYSFLLLLQDYHKAFDFQLDSAGTVLSLDSAQGRGGPGQLQLVTHSVDIDVGGYPERWSIPDSDVTNDNQTINLPAAHYQFNLRLNYYGFSTLFDFEVGTDGKVSSAELCNALVQGNGIRVITQAVHFDVGGAPGTWVPGDGKNSFSGNATLCLPPSLYRFDLPDSHFDYGYSVRKSESGNGFSVSPPSYEFKIGDSPYRVTLSLGTTSCTYDLVKPAPLQPGVEAAAELTPSARFVLYSFRLESEQAGKPVVFTLTDEDPGDANSMYVRWGGLPTPCYHDQASRAGHQVQQRLVVPSARAEDCYVLVRADLIPGGLNQVRLKAEVEELILKDLAGSTLGEGGSGRLDVSVRGAGFSAATRFSLELAGPGTRLGSSGVLLASSERADVLFETSGAEPGVYDLVAEEEDRVARLQAVFRLAPTRIGPVPVMTLTGPTYYRAGRLARLTLAFSNQGDEEMVASLVRIVGPAGTELRLAGQEESGQEELQLLCLDPSGVGGMVLPGAAGKLPILCRNDHPVTANLACQVQRLNPGEGDYVDWQDLDPAQLGLGAEEWADLWPKLSVRLGASWKEYHRSLADLATRLQRRGTPKASVLDLFRFAVREALGRPSSAITGRLKEQENGAGIPAVTIQALDGEIVRACAATEPDGHFVLDGLDCGKSYQLLATDYRLDAGLVPLPCGGDLLGIELEGSLAPQDPRLVKPCPDLEEGGLPKAPPSPPAALFPTVADTGKALRLVQAIDPNTKEGPTGEGDDPIISSTDPIHYTISFENRPPDCCNWPADCVNRPPECGETTPGCQNPPPAGSPCPASAQDVVITDVLDPGLDPDQVVFEDFHIGGEWTQWVNLDTGEQDHSGNESFSYLSVSRNKPNYNTHVTVTTKLDREKGILSWSFNTLRSAEDSIEGFLPLNSGSTAGLGVAHLSFSVKPKEDVVEGTIIENEAFIGFDCSPDPTLAAGCLARATSLKNQLSNFRLPPAPSCPVPSGETAVEITASLSWTPLPDADASYDVYLWSQGLKPDKPSAERLPRAYYASPGLQYGMTYHWQVVARNRTGETTGPPWTFFTQTAPAACPPPAPVNRHPPDGSLGASKRPSLSWGPDQAAGVRYEVWLWREDEEARSIVKGLSTPEHPLEFDLQPDSLYFWKVTASYALCAPPETEGPTWSFRTASDMFLRGDVDGTGSLDITDGIFLLSYLFLGGTALPCQKSADANDDGAVDITDSIYILQYLFLGGPAPKDPGFLLCGSDPTKDTLSCLTFPPCR
jgi:hypothetical protein